MMSVAVSVMRGAVDVLVDWDFDGIWLRYRHRDVFLHCHGVGLLHWIGHRLFHRNSDGFVNWHCNRMRYAYVNWVRLWHGDRH